jgi:hypothetical protein
MDWLRCEGDDDASEEACEIACGRREIVCRRGCADRRAMRFRSALSDPCRQSSAANDVETGTGTRLGLEHGGSQPLVSIDRVRSDHDQGG